MDNSSTILTTNIRNDYGSVSIVRLSVPARSLRSKTVAKIQNHLIEKSMVMRQSEHRIRCDNAITNIVRNTPKPKCGFNLKTLRCMKDYKLDWDVDPRQTVSLACMSECSDLPVNVDLHNNVGSKCTIGNQPKGFTITYMEAYMSKLPLMCINVNRLVYTARAFDFRKNPEWNIGLRALDFYLKYETSHGNRQSTVNGISGGSSLETNLDFSTLLHRLRSSGTLDYTLELARCLEYDVEVVFSRDRDKVYVYNNKKNRAQGVLTAYCHDTNTFRRRVSIIGAYVHTMRNT